MIHVIDSFVRDPQAVRNHALAAEYVDWHAPDGEVYKRISQTEVPGMREAIEYVAGPLRHLAMGYRLNFNGELPNAAIHSDIGWGTHACVLYLSNGSGGTAFWRHRKTGAEGLAPRDTELLSRVEGDWNNVKAWDMRRLVPMKLGRAVIYDANLFHSRWPFEAFGTGPGNGRLIAVAFFTPWSAYEDQVRRA